MLRHALATLAYRGGKVVRDAPAGFSEFRPGPTSRSAGEVLAHIGDLMDWGLSMAEGRQAWTDSTTVSWEEGVERFHGSVSRFDAYLESGAELGMPANTLFQGPVADALTHVGQLAMMRRLAGSPVKGENYSRAEIVAGRTGRDQSAPRREFD